MQSPVSGRDTDDIAATTQSQSTIIDKVFALHAEWLRHRGGHCKRHGTDGDWQTGIKLWGHWKDGPHSLWLLVTNPSHVPQWHNTVMYPASNKWGMLPKCPSSSHTCCVLVCFPGRRSTSSKSWGIQLGSRQWQKDTYPTVGGKGRLDLK